MHYTLSELILEVIQNAIESEAGIIIADILETPEELNVYVADNGKGMSEDKLSQIRDPYFTDGIKHEKRKVGLGIPFLAQTLSMTDGKFDITSEPEKGTSLFAKFNLQHIDTPPMGDVIGLFTQALCFWGSYELVINRKYTKEEEEQGYSLIRSELMEALGGSLEDSDSIIMLKKYITSQEEDISKGGNHGKDEPRRIKKTSGRKEESN